MKGINVKLINIIIIVFFFLSFISIGGCSGTDTGYSRLGNRIEQQGNPELMEGLDKSVIDKGSNNSGREDMIELKHLKYGRQGPVKEEPAVAIQFLSEEEMEEIVARLVELNYLEEGLRNKEAFRKAVFQFQKDQGIRATGELDAQTIDLLKESKN